MAKRRVLKEIKAGGAKSSTNNPHLPKKILSLFTGPDVT
jgi:hypothetical protein